MSKEGLPRAREEERRPLQPFELPGELAYFLKDADYAMLSQGSDQGTIYVVKVPGSEIGGLQGRTPIHVRHELYQHPAAPVIRTTVTIYDQPDRPLAMETFINVAEEDQRQDFATLTEQEELLLAFYDEDLTHQLTKRVANNARKHLTDILQGADQLRAAIPEDRYDFDRAKAEVLQRTRL